MEKNTPPTGPRIIWDSGSAYDLFASLIVLHQPDSFGVRRAWAAGVRNRVSSESREILSKVARIISIPSHFLLAIDGPKDAAAVLHLISRLGAEEVLPSLADPTLVQTDIVKRAQQAGRYTDEHINELVELSRSECTVPVDHSEATLYLELFARAGENGAAVQRGLAEYYERFFCEEEERTIPAVAATLKKAQNAAQRLPIVDLVEELSGGLRLEDLTASSRIVLIPAFWAGPLIFYGTVDDGVPVVVFSARRKSTSLVPGQQVPDSLQLALQALSDQSRLRILKLVAAGPMTQAEIARELRLRPPTITHHLRILRMANLVRLTESTTGEKRYTLRDRELRALPERLYLFVGI